MNRPTTNELARNHPIYSEAEYRDHKRIHIRVLNVGLGLHQEASKIEAGKAGQGKPNALQFYTVKIMEIYENALREVEVSKPQLLEQVVICVGHHLLVRT